MTLPIGWAEPSFAEIARQRSGNGKLIKGKLQSEPLQGSFPAFSASGQDVWRDDYEYEGDAIIVSAVGARCGKAFRASGRWSAIANTHVVIPEHDAVDTDFLFRILNDEDFWVKGGTAQPFVKVGATFEKTVLLPPLAEQRRIVAKLDALTARLARARAELDRVPVLAASLRQAALDDAFGVSATEEDVTLSHLGQWSSGGTPKSSHASYYGGDIPWLRSGDLPDGPIDGHVITITENGLQASSAKWVPAGAVLVAMYGATIGKLGITTYPVTTNQAVACIVPEENVDVSWLFYLLLQKRPQLIALGQGGAQPNISQQILKAIPVSRPSYELQRIVAINLDATFARAERLEAEAARARKLLDRLESALLAKAFRGELVPQDPNDEPAQALLDRIRTQRAAAPKTKRGRKAKISA